MAKLRDKLPQDILMEFGDTKAARMLDVEVVAEHGSDGDNKAWPGPHRFVYGWWELANGYAVAWNENPAKGYSFPVVRIPGVPLVKAPSVPEKWIDAKGQVAYVKGSRQNREDGLIREEMEAVKDLRSGTVTRVDGKVFYAPFRKVEA